MTYVSNNFVRRFVSLLIGLCVCLGLGSIALADVAYDNSVYLGNTGGNSVNADFTTSGSNITVVIGCLAIQTDYTQFSAKVDGSSATYVSYSQQGTDPNKMVFFQKSGLSSGTHNAECDVTSSGGFLDGIAASYNGTDSVQPDNSANLQGSSITYTTLNNNAMVVVLGRSQGYAMTAGTNLTKRLESAGSIAIFDSGSVIPVAGSNSFSVSSAGGQIGTAFMSLKSAAAPTPTPGPTTSASPSTTTPSTIIFLYTSMGIFLIELFAILTVLFIVFMIIGWPIKNLARAIRAVIRRSGSTQYD